ncbi:carbonic anhydrase [Nonomuraea solani]|uniref:Carbonic anhydrase n=1 Tax=Nonomuraea solani TaxID=1144553 RepID=A0A1H6ETI9_9ACTN|nr:carbonic anhydrase [Nonomuraea solani]SEH00245.1 carbonic anhydrase [Nonomuraea solani]
MEFHDLVAHARAHSTTPDPGRARLADGQRPLAMFVTCSDSRVIPTQITHTRPGQLFELRTAGNVIPSRPGTPSGELATIEYAVNVLAVRDIILCGHSHCGAVAAMTDGHDPVRLPNAGRWLAEAPRRVPYRIAGEDGGHPQRGAERRHLVAQFAALTALPVVRERLDRAELRLHCWYYEIDTGRVQAAQRGEGVEFSFGEL